MEGQAVQGRLSRRALADRTVGPAATLLVLTVLVLCAGCGPVPTATPAVTIARVGYLSMSNPDGNARPREALVQGMREHGWVEGQNLTIDWRYADGSPERRLEFVAELVRSGVRAIVCTDGGTCQVAKQATSRIPIVMASPCDAVESGLVENLARPGGNVTGFSSFTGATSLKRVELMRDIIPGLTRVAMLSYPGAVPGSTEATVEAAARSLGLQLKALTADTPDSVETAFTAMVADGAQAVILLTGNPGSAARERITQQAARRRIPASYQNSEWVLAVGLMSYGVNLPAQYRRTAEYVDRILKGADPGDLPVEQSREFELVVNRKAQADLGLTLPSSILVQVGEWVE